MNFASPIPLRPLLISHITATTCLGHGLTPLRNALEQGVSGLKPCRFETVELDTWIGEVEGLDEVALSADLGEHDCRNNRLAQYGLEKDDFAVNVTTRIKQLGKRRVGVILGTSTAGILQTELAYRRRDAVTGALPLDFNYQTTHNTYSVAGFVREYFGLEGPSVVISTACSSSSKVFAAAARMIQSGIIDAAIVGGVDSLCLTTLYGFSSLELTAPFPCRPYDRDRKGISVGEGAAFALIEPCPDSLPVDALLLLGTGESSDAYHMSSPHPDGLGAQLSMSSALASAGLSPGDIDYLNLHGTATVNNDAAEGKAVLKVFGNRTPCSSTKGITGHTLGAAGAVEAAICALALRYGWIPGSVNTCEPDPEIPLNYLLSTRPAQAKRVMSNSFGFGGSNCSIILGCAG